MKSLEAAVDALVLVLLNSLVRYTGLLDGMSPVMRNLALGAVFFAGLLALNAVRARARRA